MSGCPAAAAVIAQSSTLVLEHCYTLTLQCCALLVLNLLSGQLSLLHVHTLHLSIVWEV
jgi:hypothetical protein